MATVSPAKTGVRTTPETRWPDCFSLDTSVVSLTSIAVPEGSWRAAGVASSNAASILQREIEFIPDPSILRPFSAAGKLLLLIFAYRDRNTWRSRDAWSKRWFCKSDRYPNRRKLHIRKL